MILRRILLLLAATGSSLSWEAKAKDASWDVFPQVTPLQRPDFDPTISSLTEEIRRSPANPFFYSKRGGAYFDKGDYDRAIKDFIEVIRLRPSQLGPAYNNRALSYDRKKQYDLAISDYSKSIQFDPKNAWIYNNRGMTYKSKGNFAQAVADYSQAIRLSPSYVAAYSNRGVAFGSMGEHQRAIADYDEAIRLKPGEYLSYYNRAIAFLDIGERDRTLADLNKALQLNSTLQWNEAFIKAREQAQITPPVGPTAEIKLDLTTSPTLAMILLDGTINSGDLIRVRDTAEEAAKTAPHRLIVLALNSLSGNASEGVLIGKFLQRKGIGTVLLPGSLCSSACADIFYGGFDIKTGKPDRVAYETSRLGVHGARREDGQAASQEEMKLVTAKFTEFWKQVRVSKEVQQKSFDTPANSMYYLTHADMEGTEIKVRGAASAPAHHIDRPPAAPIVASAPVSSLDVDNPECRWSKAVRLDQNVQCPNDR